MTADRHRSESGTTLSEVLVILVITTVLAAPLLAMVRTAMRVHENRVAEDEATIELELALAAMTEDLRTGAPVELRPQGTSADDTVGVELFDGGGSSVVVYWSVGSGGLRRIVTDPDTGAITSDSTVNQDITGNGAAGPDDAVFVYRDATGQQLDPSAVGLERLSECTALVEVTLSVPIDGDLEGAVVAGTTRHAVRSRNAGSNGC